MGKLIVESYLFAGKSLRRYYAVEVYSKMISSEAVTYSKVCLTKQKGALWADHVKQIQKLDAISVAGG